MAREASAGLMMERLEVEVAIIGAGTAGMRAYREASQLTDSILLIEGRAYGTTCARVGCMPSKLLVAAAEAAHRGREAKLFGLQLNGLHVDGAAVMQRVRDERDRFVGFVVETVEDWPEKHRIEAMARFKSDHELELEDGRTITADRIVIATGSRPKILPAFKAFGERLIVNDDVFNWNTLPQSVVVFGAGVVGLELGQALHRLGVHVVLFGRDHLVGPLTDPSVLETAREVFTNEFMFFPHSEVIRHAQVANGVEVDYMVDGKTKTARFEYALIATGRQPNVDNLGLENTSLELDERGVPVYNVHNSRCGDSHIFIAGDANNRFPLLHESADEGFAAGYNAARYPDVRSFAKSAPITVMFSDPQIMMVGATFQQLTEQGVEFAIGSIDWSRQGRARVMGVNHGLLRVYGQHNTGRFLGAEMVGPRAENIAHLLAWSLQSNLTVSEMLERPFYHPVLEEGVRTALRGLNCALRMGPQPPRNCLDCGPGG
ncbi:MAG: dihydrolipoyl dehydrogenase [Hyphomicrobiaceae bacterium]